MQGMAASKIKCFCTERWDAETTKLEEDGWALCVKPKLLLEYQKSSAVIFSGNKRHAIFYQVCQIFGTFL